MGRLVDQTCAGSVYQISGVVVRCLYSFPSRDAKILRVKEQNTLQT